ncbi:hypothetical protein F511_01851 [Dorcoceras hygrometricum]|uniref:Uncharacterized protein n=1 Tax=Dorcoceras hygrometricum TaxID=472368 RepID=A0A2Z7D2F1_9LAMI|nr:hypothetical protein F511_01851 [Dorcoceras hygrometricum]
MADAENTCCAALLEKYFKLEELKNKVRDCTSLVNQRYDVIEEEDECLKQELGNLKAQDGRWKDKKEQDNSIRVALESEISILKKDIQLLQQNGKAASNESGRQLQERLDVAELEINQLHKLLEKERHRADLEKKNADERGGFSVTTSAKPGEDVSNLKSSSSKLSRDGIVRYRENVVTNAERSRRSPIKGNAYKSRISHLDRRMILGAVESMDKLHSKGQKLHEQMARQLSVFHDILNDHKDDSAEHNLPENFCLKQARPTKRRKTSCEETKISHSLHNYDGRKGVLGSDISNSNVDRKASSPGLENKDNGSISRIFQAIVREKVSVFFSIIVLGVSEIELKKLSKFLECDLVRSLDSVIIHICSALSDLIVRGIFMESCDLFDLLAFIQDFLLKRKVLVCGGLLEILESCAMESFHAAIIVLLNQLGRLGVDSNGYEDTGIKKLRNSLFAFLCESTPRNLSIPVQFAAVTALSQSILSQDSTPADFITKWFSLLSREQQFSFRLHQTTGITKS